MTAPRAYGGSVASEAAQLEAALAGCSTVDTRIDQVRPV